MKGEAMKNELLNYRLLGNCILIFVCLISIHSYGSDIAGTNPKMNAMVQKLINQTTNSKLQRAAFRKLEELNEPAVPYIIRNMDDRRKLGLPTISLENKSSSANTNGAIPSEKTRHYGTELVIDAMGAILSQITGQSFNIDYAGAGNFGRELSVAKWRGWCKEKYPLVTDGCDAKVAKSNIKPSESERKVNGK